MRIEFKKVSDFERGTLRELLKDAYSFDNRYEDHFAPDWIEFDNFFFGNPEIADRYGFITTVDDEVAGFISWDPRNLPEYVEIGFNCIGSEFKGKGLGKLQLQEAVDRIKKNDLKKIIVTTNEGLKPAQKMYEGVGFSEISRRDNCTDSGFSGQYIDYAYLTE
jgi:ribosomal protein S18 acetylase RimI-like enzyme